MIQLEAHYVFASVGLCTCAEKRRLQVLSRLKSLSTLFFSAYCAEGSIFDHLNWEKEIKA